MSDAFALMRQATDLIRQIPRIPWWRFVARRRCVHADILCIHGDGIYMNGGARSVCVDCGRRFADLPVVCRFTNKPHPSTAPAPADPEEDGA